MPEAQAEDAAGEDGAEFRAPLGGGHAVGVEGVGQVHGPLTNVARFDPEEITLAREV